MTAEVCEVWAGSGCQALADPGVGVPVALVEGVLALVGRLDAEGAGLAAQSGAGGLGLLAERAAALGFGAAGRESCGGATRLLRSADGWVAVTLAREDDRAVLPAWLAIDPARLDPRAPGQQWASVAKAVGRRSSIELVHAASLLGLACARVGELTTGSKVPTIAERLGEAPPRSLRGVRVVNLASLWAGPLAASILVALGADVVTFESVSRPDGARATPAWFDAIHAGQRSVAADLRDTPGIETLRNLLHCADVVIEGSRPRALAQLGIDAAESTRFGPQVWVSITGYGRDEHNAARIAMGDDAAAAGGLVGWTEQGPVFLADAVADPLTGLHVAADIVDRLSTGGRWLVDVALARVAASFAGPTIPVTHGAASPRSTRPSAPPFVLGRDTAQVLAEWCERHPASRSRPPAAQSTR